MMGDSRGGFARGWADAVPALE